MIKFVNLLSAGLLVDEKSQVKLGGSWYWDSESHCDRKCDTV